MGGKLKLADYAERLFWITCAFKMNWKKKDGKESVRT
jgi:hypothetical protein